MADKLPIDHTSCCTLGGEKDEDDRRNCFAVADCIANIVAVGDCILPETEHRINLGTLNFGHSDMLTGSSSRSMLVMLLCRVNCFGNQRITTTDCVEVKLLVYSTDYFGGHCS